MTTRKIVVIGIGDDGVEGLSAEALHHVAVSDVLYGGQRQLDFFPRHQGEKRKIKGPIELMIQELRQCADHQKIVFLASGDPLFYGIGSTLIKEMGSHRVQVYPHVSSIQLAFARAGESWQDARLFSLHGRSILGFAQRLHGVSVAAVLTDGIHTPGVIAEYLLHFQMTEYDAFVGENLGNENERTAWYSLSEMASQAFASLSVVILKRREDAFVPTFHLGMDDSAFAQRKPDRGLITKREIRVMSLSELGLKPNFVLWDIGACTGSVSIEAILSTPDLQVYAIEKNAEDLENLRENQIAFRTDFTAVHAKAPDGLHEFPDPHAVFIGGSGGELPELLQLCASRLQDEGRIVVNAATIENLYQAHQTLGELGFTVAVTLIQSARSKPILQLTRFEGMNPVYLVTGSRVREKETAL